MSLLFSSMLYVLSLSSTANFNDAPDSSKKHDYNYYMQKSKNQKTAATILMIVGIGGGFATLGVALIDALGDGLVNIVSLGTSKPKSHSYTIPLLLFGVITVIGTVLLLAASRNKKTAKSLSVDIGMSNTTLLQKQEMKSYAFPTLSLKFRF